MYSRNSENYPEIVKMAISEIEENTEFVYNIDELAPTVGVSKEHLIRVFKKAVGTSPGKFLVQRRIEMVKELLETSDYTLDIIAGLTGFANSNYLCKVFKRLENQTAIQYKNLTKNLEKRL